ncbi:hypothetical protein K491DRAFT_758176 [Lophiostoma macrostomum CBS 122681]|uniref:Uncharacterized protein n=1 Tax=Lophiostoma macrostomum CBS 122681 TaxID=1314788 RepID=A0A6A6T9Q5_9PLEO|nr:hypothetical protein K491DRAFT_758176 [Lophiostoma macrostomum CBS 122681]
MGPSTLEGVHALLSASSPLSTFTIPNTSSSHNPPHSQGCLGTVMVSVTRGLSAIAAMVPGRNISPSSMGGSHSRSGSQASRPRSERRGRGLLRGRGLDINGLHDIEDGRDESPLPPPRPRYGVMAPGPRVAAMSRTAGRRRLPPQSPERWEADVQEPFSEECVEVIVRDMGAMLAVNLDSLSTRSSVSGEGEGMKRERGGERSTGQ